MRVPAYDLVGARIAIRAILDMQPRACIKLPSSCIVLTHTCTACIYLHMCTHHTRMYTHYTHMYIHTIRTNGHLHAHSQFYIAVHILKLVCVLFITLCCYQPPYQEGVALYLHWSMIPTSI